MILIHTEEYIRNLEGEGVEGVDSQDPQDSSKILTDSESQEYIFPLDSFSPIFFTFMWGKIQKKSVKHVMGSI